MMTALGNPVILSPMSNTQTHGYRVITPTLPDRNDIGEDRSWVGHDDNVAAVAADPCHPVFEPKRRRRPVHRELPASFVVFKDDQTMPPGFWHPARSSRLNGAALVELDGDHELPLSGPDQLAEALHHATDPE
jgi:hypothetical protein